MPVTPHDSSLAIDLRDVAKRYRGRVDALKGIDMHVRRGEIFGLLGPNGAGKSTLVKIVMTLVRPTRAAGAVLGEQVGHKPTLARIGYLPENHRFPRYLTGRQIVEFFGALSNVDRPTRRRRAAELIEIVGMRDAADRKVGTYSKGMAQRIGLAQALVNDPDLVLLDEPTDGVDPVGRRDIRDVLHRLRAEGKTVFINSHLLSELEMICDRVAILVAGRVATQGTLDDLTLARQRYEIETGPTNGTPSPLAEILAARIDATAPAPYAAPVASSVVPPAFPIAVGPPPLPARSIRRGVLPTGHWVEIDGPLLRVGHTAAEDVQPLIDALRAAGVVIHRMQLVRPSLEDLFIEAVSGAGATLPDPRGDRR
jgi:ABC-2 type transport system ATP-binding protein